MTTAFDMSLHPVPEASFNQEYSGHVDIREVNGDRAWWNIETK